LRPEERRTLRELDRRFQDPAWTRGVARPASPVWRLKVRAGVWLYSARRGCTGVAASVVGGRVDRLRICDDQVADSGALGAAMQGRPLSDAPRVLGRWGPPGRRVADTLGLIGASTARGGHE
ncbi:MAG: hypothetical protein ACYC1D_06510, partial [Acidimicrobiales bacterium]